MSNLTLTPGTYALTVEGEAILFRIGRKRYAIADTYLMDHPDAPCRCLCDLSRANRYYPLKQLPANRFTLGRYADVEIVVNFNHVEIKERCR